MSRHVLVPFDESNGSEHALEHALEQHPDATITLLHVVDLMEAGYSTPVDGTLPGFWEDWFESEKAQAEELFEGARARASEAGVEVETETVVGRPTRAINDYAEEHDVDHVVMGSHGRSGVSRVLLGSVAEGVVRRAPVPVTVVR
ncbi:universal stress protein [Halorubellus sp. JP-L1]|uniref:universal stress protein n=1 Tax=Halorubellus sp. JP-L1 TaxID=2715753 RepID=UPI00140D8517|nr:universal stress protein [Halorubellus sp. JP-L1]NHN43081.1 universal stress protein [Halorubellus sp. JP-L1]